MIRIANDVNVLLFSPPNKERNIQEFIFVSISRYFNFNGYLCPLKELNFELCNNENYNNYNNSVFFKFINVLV